MKPFFKIIFFLIFFTTTTIYAQEYLYILNDKCINNLYIKAQSYFINSKTKAIKDPRGIILRINFEENFENLYINIKEIEDFLAKIENPAIIEVHTGNFSDIKLEGLKKWEISTVLANKIEDIITKPRGTIIQSRINSVGYGEFLPAKNTPNNGGKDLNRVDIIILCNVSGE